MNREIFVIGLQRGFSLSGKARERLAASEVILASQRLFDIFKIRENAIFREKIKIIPKVEDTVSFLRGFNGKACVLASGDPLFFGIGGVLLKEFPREEVFIYPAISSIQLAFARAGKSWEDAFFVSLHGPKKRRWRPEDLPLILDRHTKIAVLTGGENGPGEIARFLPDNSKVIVLERLGLPDENMLETTASKLKAMDQFREPNLLIIEAESGHKDSTENVKICLGLEEDEFGHSEGLITKDEVRAVVLHKLKIPVEGVLWDIGAGSGSVGIEAKRLSPGLDVYAVEKERDRAAEIIANSVSLHAGGINIICGEAPSTLEKFPAPDRVFIGGSGGGLVDIIKFAAGKMREGGIIVVSAITLESINEALLSLEKEGFQKVDAVSIAASRMVPIGTPIGGKAGGQKSQKRKNYFKALNPVFVIRGSEKK